MMEEGDHGEGQGRGRDSLLAPPKRKPKSRIGRLLMGEGKDSCEEQEVGQNLASGENARASFMDGSPKPNPKRRIGRLLMKSEGKDSSSGES